MIDLSIIVPGIRNQFWSRLYSSAMENRGEYNIEFIFVGPYDLPEELKLENVRYIKDFGTPTRCVQLAIEHCNGYLMTYASDDGFVEKDGIKSAIDFYLSLNNLKAQIIMRYKEGENHQGTGMDDSYWVAHTCDLLRLPGIKDWYKLAPVGMQSTKYMKYLGGFDCRFEHINLCCHDLSFRIQEDGGKLYLSPDHYLNCNWTPNNADYGPVRDAFGQNDYPLLKEIYSVENAAANRIRLNLDNWKDSPAKWGRRFND